MRFKRLSRKNAAFLAILDSYLSPEQRQAFEQLWPRKTFVMPMTNYTRLFASRQSDKNLWDYLSAEMLDQIRQGHADILFDGAIESMFFPPGSPQAEVAAIYAAMAERNIPPERVIVVTGNVAARAAHARAADNLGIARRITIWAEDFVLAFSADKLAHDLAQNDRIGPDRDEPMRRFLFLNRKIKTPRTQLLMTLATTVGLDGAYISFLGDGRPGELDQLRAVLGYGAAHIADPAEAAVYRAAAEAVLAGFPISLPERRANADVFDYGWRALDDAFYRNACISLVSETIVGDAASLVITEKTLKPIFMGHPFIILGDAGTLARLRSLGFQTFGSQIDEGYDAIEASAERIAAVQREVARIAAMPMEAVIALRESIQPAIDHNRRHAMTGFRDRIGEGLLTELRAMLAANP